MAKQTCKVVATDLKVGDLVNFSCSQDPSDRFHRITALEVTKPYEPIPGHSKACTILIRCGKRASVHVPPDTFITCKR